MIVQTTHWEFPAKLNKIMVSVPRGVVYASDTDKEWKPNLELKSWIGAAKAGFVGSST